MLRFSARKTPFRGRPVSQPKQAEAATESPGADPIARPVPAGTLIALIGIAVTSVVMGGRTSSEVARSAAIGVGLSLGVSVLADLQVGLRNLVRADLLALFAFYFLTLFEFLFPHPEFDQLLEPELARSAVVICLWGYVGLLVGRHLSQGTKQPLQRLLTQPVARGWLIGIFWFCFFMGFAHMLLAVNFNVFEMVHFFLTPRFTQPWGRGRLGDWKALFYELQMLLNLVPPMAGIMFARRKSYHPVELFLVGAGVLFVLFYGFTTGTRNLFHTFVITFVIGYAFADESKSRRNLITIGVIGVFLVLVSTVLMLEFRQVGLQEYMAGRRWSTESAKRSLSVDLNLYSIACLARVFPRDHAFIGLEVPYLALIRPIPRALWPGKPEGMSLSIEDAVGAGEGWTVAASFAGEAYMSGGIPGVLIASLAFGYLTAWWNRLASRRNSQFGILVYASGFFAAVISMRSLFVWTTALLPTLAAIIGGQFLIVRKIEERKSRLPGKLPS
jgi:hypothetical protein